MKQQIATEDVGITLFDPAVEGKSVTASEVAQAIAVQAVRDVVWWAITSKAASSISKRLRRPAVITAVLVAAGAGAIVFVSLMGNEPSE